MTEPPTPAPAGLPPQLTSVLAQLAAELPPASRHAWIRVLQSFDAPGPRLEVQLVSAWPSGAPLHLVRALVHAWTTAPAHLEGTALAVALEAAAQAHHAAAHGRRVDLVISGPATSAVPLRHTSQVITEVIRAAHQRLLVVTFAAHRIPAVVTELHAAADRGVHLDLVVESTREDGGALSRDARTAFGHLPADYWHWPPARRPAPGQGRAALHAKIIAADDHTALLGSANLTGHALAHNLEVGALLRNPHVVGRLVAHFHQLMHPHHGVLHRL